MERGNVLERHTRGGGGGGEQNTNMVRVRVSVHGRRGGGSAALGPVPRRPDTLAFANKTNKKDHGVRLVQQWDRGRASTVLLRPSRFLLHKAFGVSAPRLAYKDT